MTQKGWSKDKKAHGLAGKGITLQRSFPLAQYREEENTIAHLTPADMRKLNAGKPIMTPPRKGHNCNRIDEIRTPKYKVKQHGKALSIPQQDVIRIKADFNRILTMNGYDVNKTLQFMWDKRNSTAQEDGMSIEDYEEAFWDAFPMFIEEHDDFGSAGGRKRRKTRRSTRRVAVAGQAIKTTARVTGRTRRKRRRKRRRKVIGPVRRSQRRRRRRKNVAKVAGVERRQRRRTARKATVGV